MHGPRGPYRHRLLEPPGKAVGRPKWKGIAAAPTRTNRGPRPATKVVEVVERIVATTAEELQARARQADDDGFGASFGSAIPTRR
jgi:hypothetical protein